MAHIVPSAACLLCLLYSRYPKRRPFLVPLALVPLALVLAGSARAAWVGLVFAGAFFMYAETASGAQLVARFLTRASVVAALFVALLLVGSVFDKAAVFTPSLQKLQAVFDVDALVSSRTARMGTTDEYATETNRWRSAWWATVWDETMQTAPVTGLGFGADLSDRFMREYYGGGVSTVRNPHNIWFTFVGRTGLVGATLFTAFTLMFFARVFTVARLARRREIPLTTLEFWVIDVVILCVAFFSHTLEGPMAAIPFWTFLGIAIAQTKAAMPPPSPAKPALRPAFATKRPRLLPASAG
jgi:O-antigen ligase